jgi:hypothetical protein
MKIGILGSGTVGQTVGAKLVQLGHEVYMGSRESANPKAITWANNENGRKDSANKRALFGTFANAAEFGEIIFNCTLGSASLDVLRMAGAKNLKGKILIDTSNPLDYSTNSWGLTVSNSDSLGEQIQREFPDTFVVKSLNTVRCEIMVNPAMLAERTDVFISGNNLQAKATVTTILRDWFGWKSIMDLGDITTSRGVEMYMALWRCFRLATSSYYFNIKLVRSA